MLGDFQGAAVGARVPVSFAGDGTGVGELSWGQQTVWRGVEARGAPIILTSVDPMPPGRSAEDVAAELGFLMSRHQSLRTRLRFADDGRPLQVVASSGETSVAVVDADDDADPRVVADGLEKTYETAERDYAHDWPIRMTVVRHRGSPAYQVFAVDHLSTDGFGTDVIAADLAGRDPVTGRAKGPVTAMQPLEQASWQTSPAGLRQSERAERYWDNLLRSMPPHRFPPVRDKRSPRYWEVNFTSRAAYLASQLIAARLETETTPVLLAAFCAAAVRVSGINPAVPRLMVNNRFRPRLADSVSPIVQTCPCMVDVADVGFDEAVRRARRASVAAYKCAYFVPARIRELLAQAAAERGEEVDVHFVINDRRGARMVAGPLPVARDVRAAAGQTTLIWEKPTDNHMDFCHIHLVGSPDVLHVLAMFDSHYLSPDAMETLLRTVEEILIGAVS